MHDDIGALCDWLRQKGRRQRRIHHQGQTGIVGDVRDGRDIEYIQTGIADCFAEEQARIGANRFFPGFRVASVYKRGLDTKARQGIAQ